MPGPGNPAAAAGVPVVPAAAGLGAAKENKGTKTPAPFPGIPIAGWTEVRYNLRDISESTEMGRSV